MYKKQKKIKMYKKIKTIYTAEHFNWNKTT